MVEQKKRRREGTDTEPAAVKALREENEELREEVERLREDRARSREEIERLRARSREEIKRLKLKIAKFEAGCQTPQEKDKEVKLPTEVWAIIAGKIKQNDVCSFALVSKQLREAQVLAGRKLVTRPVWRKENGVFIVESFTEDWCAYWSRKLPALVMALRQEVEKLWEEVEMLRKEDEKLCEENEELREENEGLKRKLEVECPTLRKEEPAYW